jgi:pimeloyl-ACP methyl ester carboxylesterase
MSLEDGGRAMDEAVFAHDGIAEIPTWFGPTDRPLFGWITVPESREVSAAVVLCRPIAEEGDKSYRTFRTLSQELAKAGCLALRFDYDGTGDSAGDLHDPERAAAWVASVGHAVAEVRRTGASRVIVVGMRMGATIAYVAAARGDLALDELVLWDPCVSGRGYLREQQVLQAAWLAQGHASFGGGIETPSYRFTASAVEEVRTLAIDGRVAPSALADRLTVLCRTDRTTPRGLRENLDSPSTDWADVDDQAELIDAPTLDAQVPRRSLDDVVRRIAARSVDDPSTVAVRQAMKAEWLEGSQVVVETIRLIGEDRLMFGIETAGRDPSAALPRVLFVNVAAERHIGSGRIWVRVGRTLAADGIVSLRVDQTGVGDSMAPPGSADDQMYPTRWLHDVPAAADQLGSGAPEGVIGVGLCSSGVSVLQAAATGALREAIGVNVVLRVTPESLVTSVSPEWTAFSRMPAPLVRLSVAHRRISYLLWRAWNIVRPESAVLWLPRTIVAAGTDLTLIVGPDENRQIDDARVWRALWGRPLRRSGRFRTVHLPDADHSLRSAAGQEEAAAAITARVREHVASRAEQMLVRPASGGLA